MMKLIIIQLLDSTLRDGVPAIASRLGTTRVASACLKWLTLALYSWKGNSTGQGDPYLVESNCSGKPLINQPRIMQRFKKRLKKQFLLYKFNSLMSGDDKSLYILNQICSFYLSLCLVLTTLIVTQTSQLGF